MDLSFIPFTSDHPISDKDIPLKGEPYNGINYYEKQLFDSGDKGFSFLSFEPTISNSGKVKKLKSEKEERKIEFQVNLDLWKNNNSLLANNNYEDSNFKEIVEMKEEAVPLILEEIRKGPTPLVHALDLIYPGVVEYDGYVPLEAICSLWEDILTGKEIK